MLVDTTPFKLFYVKHYGLNKDYFNQGKVSHTISFIEYHKAADTHTYLPQSESQFDDKKRSSKAQRNVEGNRKRVFRVLRYPAST